jgi:hypothetical protein
MLVFNFTFHLLCKSGGSGLRCAGLVLLAEVCLDAWVCTLFQNGRTCDLAFAMRHK